MFSFNPAIPDIFHSEPPALEPVTSSETVRRNLEALHLARRDFIRSESDERVQRALRHKVRPTRVEKLANGDNVYYKRKDSAEWHGPGVVIGIDNKQVIVRHGGTVVRVHTARLVGAPCEDWLEETERDQEASELNSEKVVRPEGVEEKQSNTSEQQTSGECDICPSEESASGSIVEEPEVQNATIGQNSDGDNGQELSLDRCDTKSGGFWKGWFA